MTTHPTRRRTRTFWLLLAGLIAVPALWSGQPGIAHARREGAGAAAQSPPIVGGRVMAADADARPLPNARVEVVGSDDEPVFTNGQGEFAIATSAPSLRITKAGYAPTLLAAPPTGGVLQVRLARGAVVTGVVVDELGFPANDVRVHVRWAGPAGAAPGATDFFAETDDAGVFRIGSLPPGRYTVNSEPPLPAVPDPGYHGVFGELEMRMRSALARAASDAPPISDLVRADLGAGEEAQVRLTHRRRAVSPPDAPIAGAVTGVVLDEFAEPVEGVAVRLWRVRFAGARSVAEPMVLVRQTDDRGQFRIAHVPPGRYLLAASDEQRAFAPVYFPGTTAAAGAVPFTVGRRAEASGIRITSTRVRAARVTGVALDPGGGPLRGSVTLVASQRSGAVALPARLAPTDDRGVFEFRDVPPGEYVLRATAPAEGGMRMQELEAFGAQYLTVTGPDVPPLTLATSRTATLAGRLTFDGDRSGTPPQGFLVTAVPDPDLGPVGRWAFEGRVAADGAFQIPNLAGAMRLSVLAPPGWWVASIDLGGADGLRDPVRLTGPDDSRTDVAVVVSSGGAGIRGRVVDDAGRPVDDYRVVVFSTQSRNWFGRSPHVRLAAGPEGDGGFTLRDLPPGDYWAVAVDAIEGDADIGEWQDPDVLTRLASLATRVSVPAGGQASVALSLQRWR